VDAHLGDGPPLVDARYHTECRHRVPQASAIAHVANDRDLTPKEAALTSGYIDEKRFDQIVEPKKWVGHGVGGS
jgi:hypothetical protein